MVIRFFFPLVDAADYSLPLTLGLVETLVSSLQQYFACSAILGRERNSHAECKFKTPTIQGTETWEMYS